jgi:ankyrin repeat protein
VFSQVNLLLDNKADINAKLDGQQEGAEGFTALMWAAYSGHKELVSHLIDKVLSFRGEFTYCVGCASDGIPCPPASGAAPA